MAGPERGISTGPNSRALDETLATTGPGIPTEALAPGETLDDVIPSVDDDLSPEQLKDKMFGVGEDSGAAPPDPDEPEGHSS